MVNQSRQQNGVPPVTMGESLRQVARDHARDMSVRNYFGHNSDSLHRVGIGAYTGQDGKTHYVRDFID